MVREVSFSAFTITAFSESRFWCLWAQAPLAPTPIYSPNVLRSSPPLWWKVKLLLPPFLRFFFFTSWVGAESCWKRHLTSRIQFSSEVVRHRLTWLSELHHSFLHQHHENESGLHWSMKFPSKPLLLRKADPSEPLEFCLWSCNKFWQICGHFGDWISPWYGKSFHW